MKRITTESGAVYLFDPEKSRVMRLSGPFSPGINYRMAPDHHWDEVAVTPHFQVGERMRISFLGGNWRVSTPVRSVEDV